MPTPLNTFIIYSSRDGAMRDELLRHLRPLVRAGILRVWSDQEIPAGEAWNTEIRENLEATDLFLPLVSVNFFNSEFIQSVEMPFAEERRQSGSGYVIPVLLNHCGWEHDPIISQLEIVPKGKPVISKDWENTDLAWTHVVGKIGTRAKQILADPNFIARREAAETAKKAAAQRILDEKEAARQVENRRRETAERERIERQRAENERIERERTERERQAEWERLLEIEKKRRTEEDLLQRAQERRRRAAENPTNWTRIGLFSVGGLLAVALVWFLFFKEKNSPQRSGFEMVDVQGGTCTMGCDGERDGGNDCYDSEKPPHQVTLSSFFIGKYEVTQADWFAIMGTWPSAHENCLECPVENVSWNSVQDFFKKLNEKHPGKNYRLPTEAEWEFAARGGIKSLGFKYSGGNDLDTIAWYKGNSGDQTHRVGEKKDNELGLFDMSGNVWEWCSDWYGDYNPAAQTNPTGPKSGSFRVGRGGGAWRTAVNCRPAGRNWDSPADRAISLGFRLVSVPSK